MIILQLLLLLLLANGAPILARKMLHSTFYAPIDRGKLWVDGRPLLGPSKTWRGIVSSVALTMLVAPLLGLTAGIGFLIAVTAMAGDLFSSFIKRRLAKAPSSQVMGLDQIPESLLPLLAVMSPLSLSLWEVLAVLLLFLSVGAFISKLLFLVGIRKRPY